MRERRVRGIVEGIYRARARSLRLPPERRGAFLRDLQSTFEALLARHGGGEGEPFALALACYPKGEHP